ncbi:MAG: methylmalonyl-CoA epimerase [Candidatus Aminicenantes bacterium]|nr:methylmalonyl-CoA epimerase [Candidatus Aminicenantes bacterium]
MIKKLDHIGIAVRDINQSLKKWESVFAIKASGTEEVTERGVKVAYLNIPGGSAVELIEPLEEGTPVDRFLKQQGEGIHHICLEVEDIDEAIRELKNKGIEFVSEKPAKGAGGSRIVFLRPQNINGVLIEIKETCSSKLESNTEFKG